MNQEDGIEPYSPSITRCRSRNRSNLIRSPSRTRSSPNTRSRNRSCSRLRSRRSSQIRAAIRDSLLPRFLIDRYIRSDQATLSTIVNSKSCPGCVLISNSSTESTTFREVLYGWTTYWRRSGQPFAYPRIRVIVVSHMSDQFIGSSISLCAELACKRLISSVYADMSCLMFQTAESLIA
jgi:hypothetical protein